MRSVRLQLVRQGQLRRALVESRVLKTGGAGGGFGAWTARLSLYGWACFALTCCGGSGSRVADRQIQELGEIKLDSLSTASIERVVAIEDRGDVPIGRIVKAVPGPDNSLLVADLSPTNSVYQYSSDGRFIRSFDPAADSNDSAARRLKDFDSIDDSVFLLTERLSIASISTGKVVATTGRLPGAIGLARVGSEMCLLAATAEDAVICYDSTAQRLRGFHRVDPRVLRYAYVPLVPLGSNGRETLVADIYSPNLFFYSGSGPTPTRLSFPASTWPIEKFDALWRHDELLSNPAAMKSIRMDVRRFEAVVPLPEGKWLLLELRRAENLRRWLLLDPVAGTVHPVKPDERLPKGRNTIDLLDLAVGTNRSGLIGAIATESQAEALAPYSTSVNIKERCKGEVQCVYFLRLSGLE